MNIKVLGISGSPVKKGNVEELLQLMMDAVSNKPGVTTDVVHLSRCEVKGCTHCNFCVKKQKEGKYCALDDDAQMIFEKMEAADVLVLATPVYFMRTSGHMANLIDRSRVFVFGSLKRGVMKNKVGVSAAVAWGRHGGFETTHLGHISTFLTLEMIPTSVHHCISPLGASAVASPQGSGMFVKDIRHGIKEDNMGLHSASAHMNRALELAALLKRGAGKE